jgi:hypothetical protein
MQSWRNRYRNTLQFRPPSTFNIPDNAPPSPPSDSARDPAPVPSSSRQRKEAKPADTAPKSTSKTTEGGGPKKKESGGDKAEETEISDYTLEQLAKMFNTKEWEELYAFVDIIEAMSGTDDFNDAWEQWADSQANQTAEQWRQYYHKVVRPQWERDPDWKRKQIKKLSGGTSKATLVRVRAKASSHHRTKSLLRARPPRSHQRKRISRPPLPAMSLPNTYLNSVRASSSELAGTGSLKRTKSQ